MPRLNQMGKCTFVGERYCGNIGSYPNACWARSRPCKTGKRIIEIPLAANQRVHPVNRAVQSGRHANQTIRFGSMSSVKRTSMDPVAAEMLSDARREAA
jgi:hypothetical protein